MNVVVGHACRSATVRTRKVGQAKQPVYRVVVSLSLALALATPSAAADPQLSVEWLRARSLPALDKLEAAYGQVRAKGTLTVKTIAGANLIVRSVHEIEFAFDGKNRRLVETFAKVPPGPGGAPHPSQ